MSKDGWGFQGAGNQPFQGGYSPSNPSGPGWNNQGWGDQGSNQMGQGFNNQGFNNQGFNAGGYGGQGNQGFNQGFNQGGQGFNNPGFNQGGQGFNNQGFNNKCSNPFANIGVAAFQHLIGNNFGQYGASYAIRSALGSDKCLDINQTQSSKTNVGETILYGFHGGKNQRFTISNQGEDLVIRSVQDDKALEVTPGVNGAKGRIKVMPYTGSVNQRWRIKKVDNNSNRYFLINVGDGKCLDVDGGFGFNSTHVITW